MTGEPGPRDPRPDPRAAAEAVARRSYGKLIAFLAARTRDVAGAEDALSDAFAEALRVWPEKGVPERPEGWLLVVARRRMIDSARRSRNGGDVAAHLALLAEPDQGEGDPEPIADCRLALMFVCAHPAIEAPARAPLILQTVLGFDAATIASAFLVAPATMSQRLVRAKNKIRQAGIAFQIPERGDWGPRLEAVLEAVYACFAEGWADPGLSDPRQKALAEEGIWLGRLLAVLIPDEPEVLGLLALMLHAEARRAARRDPRGEFVPLGAQDCARWDGTLIEEAEEMLRRASRRGAPGRYQFEAAIQSVHAARRHSGRTDWESIELLYDALFQISGSPVVAINRAIAVGELRGAGAGLALLDALKDDRRLRDYQPYWAARAEFLTRSGVLDEAARAFQVAIGLASDPAVRRFLQARALACGAGREPRSP